MLVGDSEKPVEIHIRGAGACLGPDGKSVGCEGDGALGGFVQCYTWTSAAPQMPLAP